jgi:hypothetical protein
MLLLAASPVAAQVPCGGGVLYFSQDDNENGLYSVDLTTGAATLVGTGATGTTSSTIGLTESDDPGVLWGSTWTDFAVINADGSSASVIPSDFEAEALGYDSGTDTLYGAINTEFFTVDPATGERSGDLPSPEVDIEGLAVDGATGLVYGVSGDGETELFVYDPGTDTWDTVGDTTFEFDSPGLAYDPINGVLYALDGETENIYRINPTTAAASLIGDLGLGDEQGGGLGFIAGTPCPPPTEPTTPTTEPPTTTPPAANDAVRPRFTG